MVELIGGLVGGVGAGGGGDGVPRPPHCVVRPPDMTFKGPVTLYGVHILVVFPEKLVGTVNVNRL